MSHDVIFNLLIVYFFSSIVSAGGGCILPSFSLLNIVFKVNNKLTVFTRRCSGVSTVEFEQVNTGWITIIHCPTGIYLFLVNIRNTKTRSEMCSKLTINIPERRQKCCSGASLVNFEPISHLF